MSPLKQTLDRIDAWLDSHPSQFAQRLKSQVRPGITRSQFHEVVGELSYYLPEEIYELYGWHNGHMEVGYTTEAVTLCSIKEASEQVYVSLLMGAAQVGSPYFPFMLADEWGAYVVCGDTERSIEYSPVYFYNKDGKQADRIVAPSIVNIMLTIAECLETHGFASAAQAALWDERFSEAKERYRNAEKQDREVVSLAELRLYECQIPDVLHSLTEEYRSIFNKIYRKYGTEGIWD